HEVASRPTPVLPARRKEPSVPFESMQSRAAPKAHQDTPSPPRPPPKQQATPSNRPEGTFRRSCSWTHLLVALLEACFSNGADAHFWAGAPTISDLVELATYGPPLHRSTLVVTLRPVRASDCL